MPMLTVGGARSLGRAQAGAYLPTSFDPYGNLPAGYTNVESDYGWTANIPATSGDTSLGDGSGWSAVFNSDGYTYRGSDATGPISQPLCLETNYAAGEGSPVASAGFGKVFRIPPSGVTAWYVSFPIWHDADFEFNAVSNKLFMIGAPGGYNILETRHFSGDFLAWQFEAVGGVPYYPATTAFGEALTNEYFRGHWVNVEIEYIIDGTTGILRTWCGRSDGSDGAVGQLVLEYTGINVPAGGSGRELNINTTWGGASGPTTRSSTRRVDHIYIAYP